VALHVQCPQCGGVYEVADEQAGGTATCPRCQTLARIPSANAPPTELSPSSHPSTTTPMAGQYHPGYAQGGPAGAVMSAEQRVGFHLKLIGVLSLIMAVLCLIWGLIALFTSVAIRDRGFPLPPELGNFQDPAAFRQVASLFYLVVGGLSVLTFVSLLASGICVLARRPSARLLGIIVAVLSCVSLWQCFLYPFCLGLGIYSIIVLFGADAQMVLDHRSLPPSDALPTAGGEDR